MSMSSLSQLPMKQVRCLPSPWLILPIVLWTILPKAVWAQGPPINTQSAIITGFEAAAVRGLTQVIRLSNGSSELTVIAAPLMIPYQVKENQFVLVAALPYLDKELKTPSGTFSTSGLGDLQLAALYNIFQRDVGRTTTRGILIGGLKLPTGDHNHPGLPDPGLQLGSGAVDYTLGTAWTYIPGRLGFDADLIYTARTEANIQGNDVRFGDSLQYDIALGYRLLPVVYETYPAKQVNLYLELNGIYHHRDVENGMDIADSGGHRLFLSPGIQFIPFANFLIEASTQIPIVEDLHGSQLKTDYAFNFGFRWLLY